MDDTFSFVPCDINLSNLLSIVNQTDACIQFTLEVQIGNCLSFLDALVSKPGHEPLSSENLSHPLRSLILLIIEKQLLFTFIGLFLSESITLILTLNLITRNHLLTSTTFLKPTCVILTFYPSLCFNITKFLSRFGFGLIIIEDRCSIYFNLAGTISN